MNVNEVIANRAHVLKGYELGKGDRFIHPNDDVNKSQSSNDTFPTAMNISAYKKIVTHTIPNIENLKNALADRAKDMADIVKIGRTHLMDATPLSLEQEFSGYVAQLNHALKAIHNSLSHLREIALGGLQLEQGLIRQLIMLDLLQNISQNLQNFLLNRLKINLRQWQATMLLSKRMVH